jgi:hypothetical protein
MEIDGRIGLTKGNVHPKPVLFGTQEGISDKIKCVAMVYGGSVSSLRGLRSPTLCACGLPHRYACLRTFERYVKVPRHTCAIFSHLSQACFCLSYWFVGPRGGICLQGVTPPNTAEVCLLCPYHAQILVLVGHGFQGKTPATWRPSPKSPTHSR